jgi:hypothetical protein
MEDASLSDFATTGAPTEEDGEVSGDSSAAPADEATDQEVGHSDAVSPSEPATDVAAESANEEDDDPANEEDVDPANEKDVDPAVETAVLASGACAACGTTVTRRWRDDDSLVCGTCLSW